MKLIKPILHPGPRSRIIVGSMLLLNGFFCFIGLIMGSPGLIEYLYYHPVHNIWYKDVITLLMLLVVSIVTVLGGWFLVRPKKDTRSRKTIGWLLFYIGVFILTTLGLSFIDNQNDLNTNSVFGGQSFIAYLVEYLINAVFVSIVVIMFVGGWWLSPALKEYRLNKYMIMRAILPALAIIVIAYYWRLWYF